MNVFFMKKNCFKFKRYTHFFGALAISFFSINTASVKAAETVVLRYGLFEESISVPELQTIAKTGNIPQKYKSYIKQLPSEKRQEFLKLLRKQIPVNFVTLSRLFYTSVGSAILQDFSKVTIREDQAGMQALRTALVSGSKTSEGLSIISFIKAYPSERITIDVQQAPEVFNKLNLSYKQTQQFMEAISSRLSAQKTQLNIPFDPSKPGSAKVQVLKLPNLKDETRQRLVPVDIYWSTAATVNKPVIILTHGFSSDRTDMRYLAEHLASHGYVVASVEHIGSNQNYQFDMTKPGILLMKPQEFLERPKDISFVLDKLAELNQTAKNSLQGKVATNNAMVIGHSFGGGTALSIAGAELQVDFLKEYCPHIPASSNLGEALQCFAQSLPEKRYQLRDSRIKQAIALNPTSSLMFGKNGLEKIQVPTLILASSADEVTPALTEQIVGFDKIPSPKWLIGIVGATHGSVKDPIATAQREEKETKEPSHFGGLEVVGKQATDIRRYMQAVTLAFANQMTSEADEYKIFLSPEYAQYASTKSFPIRLVTKIPPDIMKLVRSR
ncbi:MAG: alpha/beta hydrolase [Scytonema sp. PMC 1069.18]|nr:alpha/beta hydrolase [Scytonema sp. PMC 1069.18]MEC4881602.1 alpha/beta hydrolase [Scytonema sp. PMC 1070.18]